MDDSEYNIDQEVLPAFACARCALSTGTPIMGRTGLDHTKIKLIVISDYPTFAEEQNNYIFWDNQEARQPKRTRKGFKLLGPPNGGNIIRQELGLIGIDPYAEVFYTHVIKCSKPHNMTIKDGHIKTCIQEWFMKEINYMKNQIPSTVPVLCLGKFAWRALKFVDSSLRTIKDGNKLSKLRLLPAGELKFLGRPLIITESPNAVCKSTWRVETHPVNTEVYSVKELPPLPGSPSFIFRNDISHIRPFIT